MPGRLAQGAYVIQPEVADVSYLGTSIVLNDNAEGVVDGGLTHVSDTTLSELSRWSI